MQGCSHTHPLINGQVAPHITSMHLVIVDLLHVVEHHDGPIVDIGDIVLGNGTGKHVLEYDDGLVGG